ncbi:MAG: hypothetical protein HGB17_07450, partial [Syntrophobacteraceae bacterium]|nr:hypothetical protein [Syntrophobacteraceae bacterium]
MTIPKITTVLPFEDFPVEADRTWVDWIHDADDPKKNHLKLEAMDDILVLDVSEGHIGALFGSSILAEFGPLFGLRDQQQELRLMRLREADRGRSFVRFQQVYQGIPV